jgi:hypothetical protein
MSKEKKAMEALTELYHAGKISKGELMRWTVAIISHNAYKFQGRAQRYRNYLPDHVAAHVRKQYLDCLKNKEAKDENRSD